MYSIPSLPDVWKPFPTRSFQPPRSSCLVVKFRGQRYYLGRSNHDYLKLDLQVHENGWHQVVLKKVDDAMVRLIRHLRSHAKDAGGLVPLMVRKRARRTEGIDFPHRLWNHHLQSSWTNQDAWGFVKTIVSSACKLEAGLDDLQRFPPLYTQRLPKRPATYPKYLSHSC